MYETEQQHPANDLSLTDLGPVHTTHISDFLKIYFTVSELLFRSDFSTKILHVFFESRVPCMLHVSPIPSSFIL
jgi:hypothetical protein